MQDWPLPLRLGLTGAAIAFAAWGFATGSIVVGLAGIVVTALAFKRMFLSNLPQHQRDDD